MKKYVASVLLLLFMAIPCSSFAVTKEEVQSFVEEAAAFAKDVGKEAALKEFNDKEGKFFRGELYIFAYDMKGVNLALAPKPALVGKNLSMMVDANGVKLIQELIKIAKTKGSGWLEWNWENPVTKKVAPKIGYIIKVDDYWLGSGLYK